jgi:hypothetical protein
MCGVWRKGRLVFRIQRHNVVIKRLDLSKARAKAKMESRKLKVNKLFFPPHG